MNAAVAIVGPCEPGHASSTRDLALAAGLDYAGEFPAVDAGGGEPAWAALRAATEAPWLLVVNGDERLTPALAREIAQRSDAADRAEVACRVRVVMNFLGRKIVGGSFGARVETRLVRRGSDALATAARREAPILTAPLEWQPFVDLEDGLARVDRETSVIALARAERGERARAHHFLWRPPWVLLRELVGRRGLRDGLPGFMLATLVAARELILFAKLWEQGLPAGLRQVPSNPPPP